MEYPRNELLKLIRKVPETGCWEFLGKRDAYGFGRMYSQNKEFKAHKVFYESWVGVLPEDRFLHHERPADKCIGNACCNPEHMTVSNRRKGQEPARSGQAKNNVPVKVCPKGHVMTPDNIVIEHRQGKPKQRCRTCRQESWRKNSARRNKEGLHT